MLLFLSGLITSVFLGLHVAAGLMLGPMIAAIVMAVNGHNVPLKGVFFSLAQAILACQVVNGFSLSILHNLIHYWPLMAFGVFSVIIMSFGIGALLAYFGVMPGTTALWGTSPGAASTMVLLCGSFGADTRLTAFMLYFRVILVALTTSIVAYYVGGNHHTGSNFPSPAHGDLIPTLLLIITTIFLVPRLRLPAAPLLLTMFLGAFAQLSGFFHISAPLWLRVPAYMIIGWNIGARFTAPVLHYALRSLPAIALSSFILVIACAFLALPMAKLAHIDLLSAYLATSPGGLDTIIIISANVPIALPFIISLQAARMVAVLLLGPTIARPLGRWLERHKKAKSS